MARCHHKDLSAELMPRIPRRRRLSPRPGMRQCSAPRPRRVPLPTSDPGEGHPVAFLCQVQPACHLINHHLDLVFIQRTKKGHTSGNAGASSLMAHWGKDPALSLLWVWVQLWPDSGPGPGNFHMLWTRPQKGKKSGNAGKDHRTRRRCSHERGFWARKWSPKGHFCSASCCNRKPNTWLLPSHRPSGAPPPPADSLPRGRE